MVGFEHNGKRKEKIKAVFAGLYILLALLFLAGMYILVIKNDLWAANILFIAALAVAAFLVVLLNRRVKEVKCDLQHTFLGFKRSYDLSSRLLNTFYTFFDNYFLLVHHLFKDGSTAVPSLMSITRDGNNQSNHSLEKITAYLEENYFIRPEQAESREQGESCGLQKLLSQMEEQSKEITLFLNTIKSIDKVHIEDISRQLDIYFKKEKFLEMVVQYQYYSELIYDFITSIK